MSITITIINDEGEEWEYELPSKKEVCPDCEGHGKVLCEGMRGYAYSAEEFQESFDEEEAQEYFAYGGKYDVTCPTCKGDNVVSVVDEESLSSEQIEIFKQWEKQEHERAKEEADDRRTQRGENGYRD